MLRMEKRDVINAVPPFLPAAAGLSLASHFDGNGITGPYWGLSEMVFEKLPNRTLPSPASGAFLSGIFHFLLFSSTI